MVRVTYISNLTGRETTGFHADEQRALDSLRYMGIVDPKYFTITELMTSTPAVSSRPALRPAGREKNAHNNQRRRAN